MHYSGLLISGRRPNCDSVEPDLWVEWERIYGAERAYFDRS
jgi:hypothetical protein